MFKTIPFAKGVNLHIRQTTQFKTVNFSIKWRRALTATNASERTVLTNVLQHSNATYQTTAAFRSFLDDLYGTVLYFDTSKRGNEHTVLMNVETVNDHFLANTSVLNEVLDLLHTAIFEPNLENGVFKESIVEREKKTVIQRIESIFDDKSRFAQQRIQQILRPNEPASISANGTVEDIQKITPTTLFAAYQSMLADDKIDIYVAGDINEDEIVAKLQKALPFKDRTPEEIPAVLPQQHPQNDYVREQQDMKQGKLHIGFSTPVRFGDADFAKMQIFNGVFGGYPHAKLFMNVREKESLAYYASSSYASHYGLVFVVSGIEPKNEEKALSLIKEQLAVMQAGDITDLEIEQTKAMLTNQLKEALDSARGQIEIFDQYKDLPEEFSVEAWANKWKAVTKENIVEMAKQVQLEAVYFLCGKEQAAQ
ncbi:MULTISPECIES: pitrilysin family protein [unclassified Lysinibacillus]|uniref:EF-P 5-aminopentanol modification-associated protein YfmF n=1 Tax=unclassified Lysinibacillus TaxID=2636778 RepID=UPI002013691E|nr:MULTISPECIES: pitrilysin family protein [unclassified Lysinibacillus]MCL1695394.1 insulinase family protein [Lysinibacillus sp. BPa_S21]MCL1703232.1 insulinase family protein [Lysinibacillus sp. Bpr_S20]